MRMAGYRLAALFFIICVTFVNSQVTCPVCTNKYDPDSCTDTFECGVGWNWCELHVHSADFYSLDYQCQSHDDCVNHEIYGCHPQENETCYYCCEDLVTCKIQRDDLFTYVFPTAGPPGVTTPATTTTTEAPISGAKFTCPSCTNPYDYTSCSATHDCSSDTYDTCQLQVRPNDDNRLEYTCAKYQDCSTNEALGCNTASSQVCSYCCLDLVACQHQRDYLFDFVFFPHPETFAPSIPKE